MLEFLNLALEKSKWQNLDMKSYGQFCAVARALDVIGDRWSLLVVRELMAGPRRYSQVRDGLPGIATNLLADRLRELEANGIVMHVGDGYALTAARRRAGTRAAGARALGASADAARSGR